MEANLQERGVLYLNDLFEKCRTAQETLVRDPKSMVKIISDLENYSVKGLQSLKIRPCESDQAYLEAIKAQAQEYIEAVRQERSLEAIPMGPARAPSPVQTAFFEDDLMLWTGVEDFDQNIIFNPYDTFGKAYLLASQHFYGEQDAPKDSPGEDSLGIDLIPVEGPTNSTKPHNALPEISRDRKEAQDYCVKVPFNDPLITEIMNIYGEIVKAWQGVDPEQIAKLFTSLGEGYARVHVALQERGFGETITGDIYKVLSRSYLRIVNLVNGPTEAESTPQEKAGGKRKRTNAHDASCKRRKGGKSRSGNQYNNYRS